MLGWVEAFGGRADVVVTPADGSRPPIVVTAVTGVSPIGASGGGAWCWAGPDHVVVSDADGRLVRLAIDGSAMRVLSRDGRAAAPASPPSGEVVAFVLERDDTCDVAVVPADGAAWPRRVSFADYAWDPSWAPDARRLVWHEWDLDRMSWDGSRIVLAGADGEDARVVAGGDDVSVGQPRFSPDGSRLAWIGDDDGWWNVRVAGPDGADAAALLTEPCEHAEPAWGPGQRSFAWSPRGDAIALSRNEDGFGRLVVAPVRAGDGVVEPREVAKGWHHGLDWGDGGIAAVRSGARTPPTVCVTSVDDDEGVRRLLARGAPAGFEAADLVEPEPVTWDGDDGATIFGLLTRPVGGPGAGPAPLLVDVHGGPTGQASVQWKPLHHYFVTRGWAVLAPDPRGSTGHGRDYTQALRGEWGALDVSDCAAGIRAVGERGWADPARVAACGGSAGGLTVLLLAAHHGALLRAAISMYGVTDLFELAASTHRFESRYLDRIVGELPRDAERYRARSPVTHAASIRIPTLVLQGDADPVVPSTQAAALVDAIRAAGGNVEHHVYEGEGHGWAREETVLDVYARMESFLRRWVLGGGVLGGGS
jgi:dipeptidyl aminopeptidase/acylaminoacyl peptidase